VHGFTGSPFEMRLLGEHLGARGFAVTGARLAGHGGTTRDLASTRWPDWLHSVERAFDTLRARCQHAAVVGLSLGGLLTLELARRRKQQISSVSLLATALWLPVRAVRFDSVMQAVPLVRNLALPKLAGSDIRDPEMRRLNQVAQGRAGMPLPALHSLIEFGQYLKPRVHEVTHPALLMHSRQDHTVPFACMDYLAAHLGSREVVEVPLEQSFHVITLDVEREHVFRAVTDFVTEQVTKHAGEQDRKHV
jgi:carboxylesterase